MNWRTRSTSLEDTQRLAHRVAHALPLPFWLALEGDLGAGKTTFTRALLVALGWRGVVRSPTYTLMEPYPLDRFTLYHLDLYRLSDPEELEFLGLRELQGEHCVVVVEWPDKGAGVLPTMDATLRIRLKRQFRVFECLPHTGAGERLVQALAAGA